MVIVFITAFVIIPTTVETTNCLNPVPTKDGAVCNWKEKEWILQFDLETMEYYYTLKETNEHDNFIEKSMRKRYLKKGGRYVITREEARSIE